MTSGKELESVEFPKDVAEAQSRIETWLEEEGFNYSQAKGKQAHNTSFNYLVTLPSGSHINILQFLRKKDSICVSTGLRLSNKQMTIFSQKTQIERNEILNEVRFKLASVDVQFSFQNGKLPKVIRIDHPIYYDALTKDRFFKAIAVVFKASMLAIWVISQAL